MRPLKHLKLYLGLGGLYIFVLFFVCLVPLQQKGPEIPFLDKWTHFAAYGVLMAWFGQLADKAVWRLALIFVLMGGLIELLQGWGGVRSAEWADFAANAVGVALGWAATQGKGGRLLQNLEA